MTTRPIARAVAMTMLAPAAALAQPQVPDGFTIRLIAPRLDGVTPQLEAIDDPSFGTGVLGATVSADGILTVRLIEPSGTIRTIATSNQSPFRFARRIRLDSDGLIDGAIHVCLTRFDSGDNYYSRLLSIDESGQATLRWTTGRDLNYDFEYLAGPGAEPFAMVLLDGDAGGGTRLATMDQAYTLTTRSTNSVPSGRTDTDVDGMARDVSGLYGGGLLLADSDCNTDNWSGVYELNNVAGGGTYRLIGDLRRCADRNLNDIDVADQGIFGNQVFVTEGVSDQVQAIDPDGTYRAWATGFANVRALSIAPDGESMYVSDSFGVWLIRESGIEPGPVVIETSPSVPSGSLLTGGPVTSLRIIFNEPVDFTDADVTITDMDGDPVAFDASGSGSQFMLIGLGEPLDGDTYTVTIDDAVRSVATGEALDGDRDGVAGGDALLEFAHACAADFDGDGSLTLFDFLAFQNAFDAGCP